MKKLGLLIALAVAAEVGCSATAPDDDYTLQVRLVSDAMLPLREGAQVRFSLWGYSIRVADVPATLLETYDFPLSRIPQSFGLRFAADRLQMVEYRADEPGEIRYYVTFDTDVNADGCFECAGDYRWDYDKTEFVTYAEWGAHENSLEVHLKPVGP